MSKGWITARVIVLIALRNLVSHRVKSMIVGAIIVFGTMLVIVGTAMLDSVEASMQRVVTSSLTGQLQAASDKGRDELALFGGLTASLPELGEIEDFSRVKESLEAVENVRAVVPMGIGMATGSTGNDLDRVITDLRDALRQNDRFAIEESRDRVMQMAALMREELDYRTQVSSDATQIERDTETLDRVTSEAFWEAMSTDPEPQLLYLDTRFAPLSDDGRLFFLRYLGTDPQLFQKSFDRFKIDEGEMIPPGQRGVMISRRTHERFLKHRVAREFDRIKREIEEESRDLDEDEELQGRIRRLGRQYRRIVYQLDPKETQELDAELTRMFPTVEGTINDRLTAFLTPTGAEFDKRYEDFYRLIAPRIELYQVHVGDTVALQSFTRSGYLKAVNAKVWGTFTFEGIEDSDLAGVVNIMDMITFRELYGKMTEAQQDELAEIREEVGVEDVDRQSAEDDLFGGGDDLVDEQVFDKQEDSILSPDLQVARSESARPYTQRELNEGIAINAAIILEDPARIDESLEAVQRRIERDDLGLRVVDWQSAAGLVGQLIVVIRLVLYVAIGIIFAVALVIINNSMVMATMERVAEVGTMRAIGAHRRFVLALFLLETTLLGAISGALGALGGAAIITIMGAVGLPATNEIVRFLFAGPRLYPEVSASNIVVAIVIVAIVSVISTLYPAIVATRIQPVLAMRGRD